jgi:hypothetical protein
MEKENLRFAAEHERKQAAYAKMRAEVVAWHPPTVEHDGLKRFMLEQIDMCYSASEKPYQVVPSITSWQEWYAEWLDGCRERVKDCREDVDRDAKAVEKSRSWLAALEKSLPPKEGM